MRIDAREVERRLREQVARAVDPGAFMDVSGAHDPRARSEQPGRQAVALRAADRVLAAVHPTVTAAVVETVEALDALPTGSVVVDRFGDAVCKDQPGIWSQSETASMGTARLVRYGPFRVLYQPGPPVAHPDGQEQRPWEHEGHHPVQHRDRQPPWCNECGWTSPVPAVPAVQVRVDRQEGSDD